MTKPSNAMEWTGYDHLKAAERGWTLAPVIRQDWTVVGYEGIQPLRDVTQQEAWQAVAEGLGHGDEQATKAVYILMSRKPEYFARMVKSCPAFSELVRK